MKNIITLVTILFLITISLFTACKKSDTNDVTSGPIKSPFTVKYEITSDKASTVASSVLYTNSSLGSSVELTAPLVWSKTVTITTDQRPTVLFLYSTGIKFVSAGKVTGKIYINGKEKASVTESANDPFGSGFYQVGILDVKCVVN
jgi:hypothetical protein